MIFVVICELQIVERLRENYINLALALAGIIMIIMLCFYQVRTPEHTLESGGLIMCPTCIWFNCVITFE